MIELSRSVSLGVGVLGLVTPPVVGPVEPLALEPVPIFATFEPVDPVRTTEEVAMAEVVMAAGSTASGASMFERIVAGAAVNKLRFSRDSKNEDLDDELTRSTATRARPWVTKLSEERQDDCDRLRMLRNVENPTFLFSLDMSPLSLR